MLDASCRSMAEDWADKCMAERDVAVARAETALREAELWGEQYDFISAQLRVADKANATLRAHNAMLLSEVERLRPQVPDWLAVNREFG